MRRADLELVAAAGVMMVVATMRVGAFWRAPDAAAGESVSAAKPVLQPADTTAVAKPWPRPLFSRSNSGADALDASAMAGTGPSVELPRLIGVIINQNDRVAVLGYAGKVQHLQENGKIGTWTLSRIERRSATLKNESGSHLLQLIPRRDDNPAISRTVTFESLFALRSLVGLPGFCIVSQFGVIALRWHPALILLLSLQACAAIEPRKADPGPSGVGILGSSDDATSGGRPAARALQPIYRDRDGRERAPYIENGTGQYVDVAPRKQVEFDGGGPNVSLNFVDVDVQEFVRAVFDEVLKENVIINSGLKGRITLRTSSPVARATAIDLVRQALQANGASLTQSGNVYRVLVRSDQKGARRFGESVRIIPLTYISADEAKGALAPFAQGGVEITPGPSGKYIAISGGPTDLDGLEQVVSTLDVDQMKGMSMGLFPLREASAGAVANELGQMFGRGSDSRGFRSMPITRMNAVLVISPQPNLLADRKNGLRGLIGRTAMAAASMSIQCRIAGPPTSPKSSSAF